MRRILARHLLKLFPLSVVHIATPTKPKDAKATYDWNDALMDGADATALRDAIKNAPRFDALILQVEAPAECARIPPPPVHK